MSIFQCFLLVLFNAGLIHTDSVSLAILHLESAKGFADVCALYNPYYTAIPFYLKDTPKLQVYIPNPQDGCSSYQSPQNVSSVLTDGGNCSFFNKLQNAYHTNAKQVIILSDSGSTNNFPLGTDEEHKQVHLSVALIRTSIWDDVLQSFGVNVTSQLYHPHDPIFDPNLVVIWILAVFTVVTGAYWCGHTFEKNASNMIDHSFYELEQSYGDYFKKDARESEKGDHDATEDNNSDELPITTAMVIVFIILICATLLLLYFFYKYLIYVVIGLFAIAAVSGTFHCMSGLMSFINCGKCRLPENNLPLFNERFEIREIILLFCCIGLSVYWVIIRNTEFAWILQDFLGVCFCVSLLKIIRLPNMKIGTLLLLALLVYDIFFVFITPLFSARGKSVMVEVATGNGSKEQLPMVIKVPKFIKTALSICERPYSLLGFGDVLLPGLFVAFCHNFDIIAKTKYKVYFLTASIGYGIGLAVTFIALIYMKVGQPALLYLAPAVLLSATIVGLARGELKQLWRGRVEISYLDEDKDETEQLTSQKKPSYNK